MASYDDGGNRPISAVFNAPIPDSMSLHRQQSQQSLSTTKQLDSVPVETHTSPSHPSSTLLPETTSLSPATSISGMMTGNRKNTQYERLSAVEAMTQDAILELVDQIMQKADLDKDGKLSESEFYQYAVTDNSLLCWFEAIDTVF